MTSRHLSRLATTFFVVLSLLFSQLALASYVCPQQSDMQAMAATMKAGMPCDGMDLKQPALCHQHATDPGKTFEAVKLPTASTPMVVHVLALPLLDADEARSLPLAATRTARPPPDPLFLATLRLRV